MDAMRAREAGAEALHVHPRSINGEESLAAADIAATLMAVRKAVPGMPVGVATGAWIETDVARRVALIAGWTSLPDYASVNLSEDGAFEVLDMLLHIGVGIEAGIWDEADAQRFIAYAKRANVLRILIELQSDDGEAATAQYHATRAILNEAGVGAPILLHGEGGSVWPMIHLAYAERLDTRVGLEDGVLMPDGERATDNAALVGAARLIMQGVG